jgi:hypothetical protein
MVWVRKSAENGPPIIDERPNDSDCLGDLKSAGGKSTQWHLT